MTPVDGLVHSGARLIDAVDGVELAGPELAARVAEACDACAALPTGAVFARMHTDVASILRYLGAFAAGRPVALLDPALDADALRGLVERFRPAAVVGAPSDQERAEAEALEGYDVVEGGPLGRFHRRASAAGVEPFEELAVLLPTSGSTGNPKLVRLSRTAILANAAAIAEVLHIGVDDVAVTALPLHYSYGMSVLNSHLLRGATILVEPNGVVARPFWAAVEKYGVTSLAGVPYHYEMLRRLKFDPVKYPTLRTLTQAGGKLPAERIAEFSQLMHAVGGSFYVMYGQTEAAPRMATLPSARVRDKAGSVGPALPGGSFTVRDVSTGAETAEPGVTGEVVYRGPNVMLGYAESAADLAAGDLVGGVLATGDLGHLDDEGFLHVTGRIKRIGKVFGVRVSLDDLEQMLRPHGVAACVPGDDKVVVYIEGVDTEARKAAAKDLAARLHTHPTGFDVRSIEALPLLPSGKPDYRTLERLTVDKPAADKPTADRPTADRPTADRPTADKGTA